MRVVIGLVTLALVGMLQGLGALVETELIDQAWRSDASGEDERGGVFERGSSIPDAAGPGAPGSLRRVEIALEIVDDTTPPTSGVRLPLHESRAPPALLAHLSR